MTAIIITTAAATAAAAAVTHTNAGLSWAGGAVWVIGDATMEGFDFAVQLHSKPKFD